MRWWLTDTWSVLCIAGSGLRHFIVWSQSELKVPSVPPCSLLLLPSEVAVPARLREGQKHPGEQAAFPGAWKSPKTTPGFKSEIWAAEWGLRACWWLTQGFRGAGRHFFSISYVPTASKYPPGDINSDMLLSVRRMHKAPPAGPRGAPHHEVHKMDTNLPHWGCSRWGPSPTMPGRGPRGTEGMSIRHRLGVTDEDTGEDQSQSGETPLNLLALTWRGTFGVPQPVWVSSLAVSFQLTFFLVLKSLSTCPVHSSVPFPSYCCDSSQLKSQLNEVTLTNKGRNYGACPPFWIYFACVTACFARVPIPLKRAH